MKKVLIVGLVLVFGLCVVGIALADPKVEAKEKCEKAVEMIKKMGLEAAIAEINKKESPLVSDVTYVFLMDNKGVMLGHPVSPNLIGKNLIDLKDKKGRLFFREFIDVAEKKGSGWVEYQWPKPGEEAPSSKISYIMKADENHLVGAGYYP